jgi:hypothetical protein
MNMRKGVHTTIDHALWKHAQLHDLNWSEALETGIKVILGHHNKPQRIREQIQKHENTIMVLNQQLEDILKKQEKEQEQHDPDTVTIDILNQNGIKNH